ncbi:diguanylate cyclase [Oceaniglobus trochenteri]|uniref:diguanylate cyclase n=1 Tax=Oceaniglobus trochenteri TaxID=2763260 RepID=UPI001CFFEF9E|nr:diguanylate cyclase [Oceaniglobus trochenteri]
MAGRILIADDVATNRIVLKVKLAAAQYRVSQCDSAARARSMARAEEIDLMILPPSLPDMDGAALCRQLKSDPVTAALPILMLLDHNQSAHRLAALSAGADEVMSYHFSETCLLARVRSLLRAHDTDRELRGRDMTAREMGFAEAAPVLHRPGRVALIGASPEQAVGWKSGLRGLSTHGISLMGRSEAMQLSPDQPAPDAFVLATGHTGLNDGLRLLSELRSRPATRHAAILMVHGADADELQATALDIGANALLEEGFDPAELALRLDRQIRRKRDNDILRNSVESGLRMATIDPLTGLFNRRYGNHHLARLAERAARNQRSFAVLMIDIDRFKTVNDTHGHSAGDIVLAAVARGLQDNLRAVDLVARYGGEEFVVALPDATLPDARLAAERLCRRIAALPIALPDGGQVRVTISLGLAMGSAENGEVDALLARADAALYRAKSEGRNRVCIAPTARLTEPAGPDQGCAPLRGPLRSDRSSRSA